MKISKHRQTDWQTYLHTHTYKFDRTDFQKLFKTSRARAISIVRAAVKGRKLLCVRDLDANCTQYSPSVKPSLKERATDNPTLPTKRLYDAEVVDVHRGAQGGGDRAELPQFNSVRSIVQRVREQNVPPVPVRSIVQQVREQNVPPIPVRSIVQRVREQNAPPIPVRSIVQRVREQNVPPVPVRSIVQRVREQNVPPIPVRSTVQRVREQNVPPIPVRSIVQRVREQNAPPFPVRSIVQRVREQNVPPIPGTIEDVAIAGSWAVTWQQERHLLVNDIDWGTAIFATYANPLHLRRSQRVYMDAIFRTCPRPFTQCFTILGDVHGFVVPLCVKVKNSPVSLNCSFIETTAVFFHFVANPVYSHCFNLRNC